MTGMRRRALGRLCTSIERWKGGSGGSSGLWCCFRAQQSYSSRVYCPDSIREDTDAHSGSHGPWYTEKGEETQGGLGFGKQFTEHMVTMRYSDTTWSVPKVTAIDHIPMHPASQVLHYGMACFEGIKAFRNLKDPQRIHLFRPDMHLKRLALSASRLQLPQVCLDQLLASIKDLVRLDQDWVPHMRGQSLYVRPLLFSSSAMLGVTRPEEATLTIILSPCTDVVDQQPSMVLFVEEEHCRAWPGGTGNVKLSGNYSSSIYPQTKARELFGADQVLYLSPSSSSARMPSIDECGTMNVFFVLQHEDSLQVVTPALTDTILPGVTRASIIDIIRKWSDMPVRVIESTLTLEEVRQAANNGSLIEMFACGTASGVQAISSLVRKNGEQLNPIHRCGPITMRVRSTLLDIQHGTYNGEDTASWLHPI